MDSTSNDFSTVTPKVTDSTDENVGIAFALVILAGLATSVGAAVVFFPSLVNIANHRTLAMSLGLSAGVMIFVSFVEIFQKSVDAFEEAGFKEGTAQSYTIGCFFAGVAFMECSRCIIDKLVGGHHHSHDDDDGEEKDPSEGNKTTQTKTIDTSKSDDSNRLGFRTQRTRSIDMSGSIDGESLSNSSDGEGEVMSEQQLKDDFVNIMDVLGDSDWGGTNIDQLMLPCAHHHKAPKKHVADLKTMAEEMKKFEKKKEDKQLCIEAGVPVEAVNNHKDFQDLDQEIEEREARDRIARMSFKTAIAVALHNFPEGLATFVAALSDPSLGAILAIAIAIHNIPEGLAVSLPMYYATGNRMKSFFYGAMSGMTEILAALLGWLILGGSISNNAYGILFGMVAGMMVIISVRELLPTAHRYDTDDQYVTYAFVTGMGAIALSFILFNLF